MTLDNPSLIGLVTSGIEWTWVEVCTPNTCTQLDGDSSEDERTHLSSIQLSSDFIQLSYLPSWSLSSSSPSPQLYCPCLQRQWAFYLHTTSLIFVVEAVMVGGAATAGRPTPTRFFPLLGRSSGCGYKRFYVIFIPIWMLNFEIVPTSFVFVFFWFVPLC